MIRALNYKIMKSKDEEKMNTISFYFNHGAGYVIDILENTELDYVYNRRIYFF